MSKEQKEPFAFSPPTYEIDISDGWDTQSQVEAFLRGLRELGIYKRGLLFSGFDGETIGRQSSANRGEGIVFCSKEANLTGSDADGEALVETPENAFLHALDYDSPAIAVYDPEKMVEADEAYGYTINEPTALIAVIKLR